MNASQTLTMRECKTLPLVGMQVSVIDATNSTLIGTQGTVTHETVHTLTCADKVLHKNAVTLNIANNIVTGVDLIGTFTRVRNA